MPYSPTAYTGMMPSLDPSRETSISAITRIASSIAPRIRDVRNMPLHQYHSSYYRDYRGPALFDMLKQYEYSLYEAIERCTQYPQSDTFYHALEAMFFSGYDNHHFSMITRKVISTMINHEIYHLLYHFFHLSEAYEKYDQATIVRLRSEIERKLTPMADAIADTFKGYDKSTPKNPHDPKYHLLYTDIVEAAVTLPDVIYRTLFNAVVSYDESPLIIIDNHYSEIPSFHFIDIDEIGIIYYRH